MQYDIHGGQDLEDIKDVGKEIIQGLPLFEETQLQLVKRILVNDGQSFMAMIETQEKGAGAEAMVKSEQELRIVRGPDMELVCSNYSIILIVDDRLDYTQVRNPNIGRNINITPDSSPEDSEPQALVEVLPSVEHQDVGRCGGHQPVIVGMVTLAAVKPQRAGKRERDSAHSKPQALVEVLPSVEHQDVG